MYRLKEKQNNVSGMEKMMGYAMKQGGERDFQPSCSYAALKSSDELYYKMASIFRACKWTGKDILGSSPDIFAKKYPRQAYGASAGAK